MASVPIGPGTRVRLCFTLRLAGGDEIDSTGDAPVEFTVGDGNLPPGFEQALFGLRAGDARCLEIPAEQGFGAPNPENVQMMTRAQFSPSLNLEEGLVVSFADQSKAELPGVVTRLDGELVEVDFNHPLSGKELEFDVRIVDVEQVSNEIVRT